MEERRLTIAGNSNSNNGLLPSTMIEEILSRLPVKSLCRFKCVSKPWSSLISDDPSFVALHLCKGFGEDKDDLLFRRRRRVIFTDAAGNGLHSMHLDYDDEFLNHNNEEDASDYHDNRNRNSFDFDDDDEEEEGGGSNLLATATELQYVYSELSGTLLNGNLHWLGTRVGEDDASLLIISLVLTQDQEEVQEIPLPREINSSQTRRSKLGVFREWLCVTLEGDYGKATPTYNEFWVMKEYGVGESWTKMRVSIPYWNLSHSGFWTKSHDLMVFEEKLVMYNFNDHSFQNLCVREIGKVGSVGTYLESLVSLK
ncbi:hypothetical protein L3X38_013408 [Prunus dulcis]|uniref:F-box domain-containing protein n=1 Tax=Prunus dulcis TaxID=3755 RepID=A0AAD4ZHB1_PRUDU|nr:hypothetical protein L3X38_013408 [Prunus dulcis]